MFYKKLFLVLICFFPFAALSNTAPWVGTTFNQIPCRGQGQGFGPFDYLKARTTAKEKKNLSVVEAYHFTSNVKNLIHGQGGQGAKIFPDLDYTLRAWPNHHQALLSISRFQLQINKKMRNDTISTPAECYFQRAIHFSPKDAGTLSIYAYFLKKSGKLNKAVEIFEKALIIAPKSSKIEYSYSLLLIDLKRYQEALAHAKKSYQLGHPPAALRNKLLKLEIWK